LLGEAELRASRSSGPGGQHANVTASRIEATLDIEASEALGARQKERLRAAFGPRVTAVSQDARSQARNREIALGRLRRKIELALHVPRKRTPTRPTAGSKKRRLDAKRRQAQRKRDRRRPADD
jgi:ribosome-associated protein